MFGRATSEDMQTTTTTTTTTSTTSTTFFHGKNGTSVIDYLICDQCTFLNVANFVVKQPSYLSDHSAIVAWITLNTRLIGDETHTPNSSNRLSKLQRQFCWEVDSHLKFENALRTETIQILIRQYMERNTRCKYLLRKRYENSN